MKNFSNAFLFENQPSLTLKDETEHVDVSTQCEINVTTCETQTEHEEEEQTNENVDKNIDEEEKIIEVRDASSQVEIEMVNDETQYDVYEMTNVSVQTDNDKIIKSVGTNTIDVGAFDDKGKFDDKGMVDIRTVKTIQYACNVLEQSLDYHYGNVRLSISTQTDNSGSGENQNVSIYLNVIHAVSTLFNAKISKNYQRSDLSCLAEQGYITKHNVMRYTPMRQ